MSRRLVCALLLALVAGIGGGCGGSGDGESQEGFDAVFEAIRGLEAGAREQKLRELAREEGNRLDVYTSLIDESQKAVMRAFERRHGIDVTSFQSESEAIARKASEEVRAGRRGTDVIETGGAEMVTLSRGGALVPYAPAALAGLAEGSRQKGWTATRFNKFVVGWNTDRVPRGRQPRSLEDLADPRWRGQVALEASDADWYRAVRAHWIASGKSEAEADRLFEAIARNARVASSHAVMTELLGAGEYSVAASIYLHQIRDSVEEGAPVAYEPLVEPVFSRPNGVGLLRSADNPAAAVLFVEWILTDGQRELLRNNADPSRLGVGPGTGAREVALDLEGFADEAREWKDRYDALIRGAEPIGE